jgi:hypothetical protein
MKLGKEMLGLALSTAIISPSCVPSQQIETPRKAVVAKVRSIFRPMIFCAQSQDEVKRTAEQRCSQNTKFYRDNGSNCVSCDVEHEIVE